MTARIEIVTGFDGDGYRHERIFADGQAVDPTFYTLDSDDSRLIADREGWLAHWKRVARDEATPVAAAQIVEWAEATAKHRQIDPTDE